MNNNLSRRLIIWVGLPALLLFAGVVWLASHRSFTRLVEQTEVYTRTLARYHAAELERRLSRASKIPDMLALMLETTELGRRQSGEGAEAHEQRLESFLREVVRRNPEIYGSCLAFQPGTFTEGKHYYAPYFYKWQETPKAVQTAFQMLCFPLGAFYFDGPHDPTFVQLGNPEYDYFHCDWYSEPRAQKQALWAEPYFDEDGGEVVMTTYSVPIRDGAKFRGIATIDIAMSQLLLETRELMVGRTGYTIILSRQGTFVAYPDASKIMKPSEGVLDPELRRQLMIGEPGFMHAVEPMKGRDAWISYTPVQNGQFYLATVYPEAEVLEQAFHLQGEVLAMGLAGLLGVFVALVVVARSISKPVSELAKVAQQVAAGNLDHEVRVDARTSEVRDLAIAFRKMTRDLKMRMEELRYTTTVKERIEGELSAARSIQFSLVAKKFPAFPDRPEIDIHAIIKPARAVGGDFYDFFFLDRHSLCLVAADVAGKGVPAALFMAVSKTLLRANAALAATPAEMLAKVNRELCAEGATSGMFVSLVFAVLDVRNGQLQMCNAGHPWPLRLSPGGTVEPLRGDSGVALGAWVNAPYRISHHQLQPGDALVFYTDGVIEALNPDERFYTAGRLQTLLSGLTDDSPERITRTVVQDVRAFCGTHEQADDLTLLAIRWKGDAPFTPT